MAALELNSSDVLLQQLGRLEERLLEAASSPTGLKLPKPVHVISAGAND